MTANDDITGPELKRRREQIGLSLMDLARRADVHRDSAFRFERGDNVMRRTRVALLRSLQACEVELRDRLIDLHPLAPEGETEPPAAGHVPPVAAGRHLPVATVGHGQGNGALHRA